MFLLKNHNSTSAYRNCWKYRMWQDDADRDARQALQMGATIRIRGGKPVYG